jgi:dissimilatory sulfite reductase (desulfoviridin) alpha/beta subunit
MTSKPTLQKILKWIQQTEEVYKKKHKKQENIEKNKSIDELISKLGLGKKQSL